MGSCGSQLERNEDCGVETTMLCDATKESVEFRVDPDDHCKFYILAKALEFDFMADPERSWTAEWRHAEFYKMWIIAAEKKFGILSEVNSQLMLKTVGDAIEIMDVQGAGSISYKKFKQYIDAGFATSVRIDACRDDLVSATEIDAPSVWKALLEKHENPNLFGVQVHGNNVKVDMTNFKKELAVTGCDDYRPGDIPLDHAHPIKDGKVIVHVACNSKNSEACKEAHAGEIIKETNTCPEGQKVAFNTTEALKNATTYVDLANQCNTAECQGENCGNACCVSVPAVIHHQTSCTDVCCAPVATVSHCAPVEIIPSSSFCATAVSSSSAVTGSHCAPVEIHHQTSCTDVCCSPAATVSHCAPVEIIASPSFCATGVSSSPSLTGSHYTPAQIFPDRHASCTDVCNPSAVTVSHCASVEIIASPSFSTGVSSSPAVTGMVGAPIVSPGNDIPARVNSEISFSNVEASRSRGLYNSQPSVSEVLPHDVISNSSPKRIPAEADLAAANTRGAKSTGTLYGASSSLEAEFEEKLSNAKKAELKENVVSLAQTIKSLEAALDAKKCEETIFENNITALTEKHLEQQKGSALLEMELEKTKKELAEFNASIHNAEEEIVCTTACSQL